MWVDCAVVAIIGTTLGVVSSVAFRSMDIDQRGHVDAKLQPKFDIKKWARRQGDLANASRQGDLANASSQGDLSNASRSEEDEIHRARWLFQPCPSGGYVQECGTLSATDCKKRFTHVRDSSTDVSHNSPLVKQAWGAPCVLAAPNWRPPCMGEGCAAAFAKPICTNPRSTHLKCMKGVHLQEGSANHSARHPDVSTGVHTISYDWQAPKTIIDLDRLLPPLEIARTRSVLMGALLGPLVNALLVADGGNTDPARWQLEVLDLQRNIFDYSQRVDADKKLVMQTRRNGPLPFLDNMKLLILKAFQWRKLESQSPLVPTVLMHATEDDPSTWRNHGAAEWSKYGTYADLNPRSFYSAADFSSLTSVLFLGPRWSRKSRKYLLCRPNGNQSSSSGLREPWKYYVLILQVLDPAEMYARPVTIYEVQHRRPVENTAGGSVGMVHDSLYEEWKHLIYQHPGYTKDPVLRTASVVKHIGTVEITTRHYVDPTEEEELNCISDMMKAGIPEEDIHAPPNLKEKYKEEARRKLEERLNPPQDANMFAGRQPTIADLRRQQETSTSRQPPYGGYDKQPSDLRWPQASTSHPPTSPRRSAGTGPQPTDDEQPTLAQMMRPRRR